MDKENRDNKLRNYLQYLANQDTEDPSRGEKFKGIFEDILQAKKQWEVAVDAISDPMLIINENFQVIRINKAATGYFSKTFRELLGIKCYKLLYGRDKNCPDCGCQVEKIGAYESKEVDNLTIPGTFIMTTHSILLKKDTANVIYLRDITEQKRTEQLLKESEWKFRSLVECSPNGILLIKDNLIQFSNRAASKILGIPNNKLGGKLFSDILQIVPNQEFDIIQRNPLDYSFTGELYPNKEYFLKRPDGIKKWIQLYTIEIAFQDDIITLANIVDITQIKEAELKMLQSEKMASVGELASGLAHEINNPIGYIMSNLRSLREHVKSFKELYSSLNQLIQKNVSSKERELWEKIENLKNQLKKEDFEFILLDMGEIIKDSLHGTEKVSKIIKSVRDFSKIDARELEEININELIDGTLTILKNQLKESVDVVTDFAEDLPSLTCYPQQISQVFLNLFLNAVQATNEKVANGKSKEKEKGLLKISTKVSDNLKDNKIIITVSDNGNGIAPDILPKIFDPFYTTRDVGQGTGLGLSISYDIIKRHNGEIIVESEINAGTIVTVILPVTIHGVPFSDNRL